MNKYQPISYLSRSHLGNYKVKIVTKVQFKKLAQMCDKMLVVIVPGTLMLYKCVFLSSYFFISSTCL